MFICGTGSFSDGDSNELPAPVQKRSKRTTSFCRILGGGVSGKNPYADRGLDKFYALLADLDGRKQKIYTEMGSEGISFVRFVYANDESDRVKPIVVRVKDRSRPEEKVFSGNFVKQVAGTENREKIEAREKEEISREKPDEATATMTKKKRFLRCKESFKLETLRQPYFYFMAIVIVVMLLLAVSGRSFAILCTSIGWYAMPTVVGGGSPPSPSSANNQRNPKRKKEWVRKPSDKKSAKKGT